VTKHKIVLIPFPFDDLTQSKVRPAVCLTEPLGSYRHVLVAFITSRVPPTLLASDLLIASNREDFALTGLRTTSVLRLHRMMTLTTAIIERELGYLPESLELEVKSRLRGLFGL
jgi:mRNA interferase MazF